MTELVAGRRIGRYTLTTDRMDPRCGTSTVAWNAVDASGEPAIVVLTSDADVAARAKALKEGRPPHSLAVLSLGRSTIGTVVVLQPADGQPPGHLPLGGSETVRAGIQLVAALEAGPGPSHPGVGRMHPAGVRVTRNGGAQVDLLLRLPSVDDRVSLGRILQHLISGPDLLEPDAIEWKQIGLGKVIEQLIASEGTGFAGWTAVRRDLERLAAADTVSLDDFVPAGAPSTSTEDWTRLPEAPSTKTQDWTRLPEPPSSNTQDWTAIPEPPSSKTEDWTALRIPGESHED